MNKSCLTAALAALLLFCCDFSFAQNQASSRHTLGLDLVPLVRGRNPALIYNLKLSNGALRIRGNISTSSQRTHENIYHLVNGNGYKNQVVNGLLAVGWQKEIRKNRFGFYFGGEGIGLYSRTRGTYNLTYEPTGTSVGSETYRKNLSTSHGFGLSGVLGARYHFSDKLSLGLEAGLPLVLQFRKEESIRIERELTTTGTNVLMVESISASSRLLDFEPFQTYIYFNFHF